MAHNEENRSNENVIRYDNKRKENINTQSFEHGSIKLVSGDTTIFHKRPSDFEGGLYVVPTLTTRAEKATSDEWNFKDARIIFSFKKDSNYPGVGHAYCTRTYIFLSLNSLSLFSLILFLCLSLSFALSLSLSSKNHPRVYPVFQVFTKC